jgi:L-iditol 2-dehydrogenase
MRAHRLVSPAPFEMTDEEFDLPDTPPPDGVLGGRLVLLGSTRGLVERFDPYQDIHGKGVAILGAHANTTPLAANFANPWTEPANRRVILDLIARGELDVDSLISDRVRPRDAATVYAGLESSPQEFLGVVFDWAEEAAR